MSITSRVTKARAHWGNPVMDLIEGSEDFLFAADATIDRRTA
jgi:hypothetical protein